MSVAQKHNSEFGNYPFLDVEEFAEVCHHLDRRYTQATLGSVRRRWKLRVCRALDLCLSTSADYTTYIQIIKPLDGELDDGDLSACLDNFSFAESTADETGIEDQEMIEAEASDSVLSQTNCSWCPPCLTDSHTGRCSEGAKATRFRMCHI